MAHSHDKAAEALDFGSGYPDGPIESATACFARMWSEYFGDEEGDPLPEFIPPRTRRYRLNEARPLRLGILAARASACANAVPRESEVRQLSQGRMLAVIVAPGFRCSPAWRTSDAVALARGMYGARDFSGMPALADALEEAGCDNAEWLALMRDTSWPWCRGCRIIDALR